MATRINRGREGARFSLGEWAQQVNRRYETVNDRITDAIQFNNPTDMMATLRIIAIFLEDMPKAIKGIEELIDENIQVRAEREKLTSLLNTRSRGGYDAPRSYHGIKPNDRPRVVKKRGPKPKRSIDMIDNEELPESS